MFTFPNKFWTSLSEKIVQKTLLTLSLLKDNGMVIPKFPFRRDH